MSKSKHILVASLVGLLALTGLTTGWTAPAGALPGVDIACEGPENVAYTPGLTLQSRPTDYAATGTYSVCTSSDATILSASFTTKGSGELSCVAGNSTGKTRVDWSNGKFSVFEHSTILSLQPLGVGIVVQQGRVIDGEFRGDSVTRIMTLAPAALDSLRCLSAKGVTSVTGPSILTFTHL